MEYLIYCFAVWFAVFILLLPAWRVKPIRRVFERKALRPKLGFMYACAWWPIVLPVVLIVGVCFIVVDALTGIDSTK